MNFVHLATRNGISTEMHFWLDLCRLVFIWQCSVEVRGSLVFVLFGTRFAIDGDFLLVGFFLGVVIGVGGWGGRSLAH